MSSDVKQVNGNTTTNGLLEDLNRQLSEDSALIDTYRNLMNASLSTLDDKLSRASIAIDAIANYSEAFSEGTKQFLGQSYVDVNLTLANNLMKEIRDQMTRVIKLNIESMTNKN